MTTLWFQGEYLSLGSVWVKVSEMTGRKFIFAHGKSLKLRSYNNSKPKFLKSSQTSLTLISQLIDTTSEAVSIFQVPSVFYFSIYILRIIWTVLLEIQLVIGSLESKWWVETNNSIV